MMKIKKKLKNSNLKINGIFIWLAIQICLIANLYNLIILHPL